MKLYINIFRFDQIDVKIIHMTLKIGKKIFGMINLLSFNQF